MHSISRTAVVVSTLLATSAIAFAAETERVKGTITAATPTAITIHTAAGDQTLPLAPTVRIASDKLLTLADIKPGDFIGTGAMKQADGHLRAVEVTVFPESARGAGEGHRGWSEGPDSSMTNATVSDIVATGTTGRTLHLTYKGGTADIEVPPDAPIVTPVPGDASLLIPGKAVSAYARQGDDGAWTVVALTVEKDGVKPP